jgi:hypothetical protein
MHGTKYQQCSSFVLGLGVLKLFITLNSYDWLRVHSVPDSISMVHQSTSNVCDLLLSHKGRISDYKILVTSNLISHSRHLSRKKSTLIDFTYLHMPPSITQNLAKLEPKGFNSSFRSSNLNQVFIIVTTCRMLCKRTKLHLVIIP